VSLAGLGASFSETEIDAGFIIGGRLGYWLENLNAPFIGLEAEVYGAFPKIPQQNLQMNISGSANGAAGASVATVTIDEADLTILNIGFNLLARYPYGKIQPYVGVGIGIFNGYLDSVIVRKPTPVSLGGSSFTLDQGAILFKDDKDTQPALQLLGGARWFLNDNIALFAEYKYIETELEFQSVEIDYDASHVYGGIEFFFGAGGGITRTGNQPLRSPPWPP
jgi:opacity protein-like surface antigen